MIIDSVSEGEVVLGEVTSGEVVSGEVVSDENTKVVSEHNTAIDENKAFE
ncbi:19284_t:CDS:2, partial [Racocetra persica]